MSIHSEDHDSGSPIWVFHCHIQFNKHPKRKYTLYSSFVSDDVSDANEKMVLRRILPASTLATVVSTTGTRHPELKWVIVNDIIINFHE